MRYTLSCNSICTLKKTFKMGFSGGSDGKESAGNVGDSVLISGSG